jgi:hypothetical protein
MQREGETVASVISCLFLLGFRDNPAQGKSKDVHLHKARSQIAAMEPDCSTSLQR